MMFRHLRLLTVTATVLMLGLPAVATAGPRDRVRDQGVIQSVDSSQIVLRALDGSVVSFAVSRATQVRLNGARASLAEIGPGLVATVVHDGDAPVALVDAFGTQATVAERGVVTALTKAAITLRMVDGGTVSIALDRSTRFRLAGLPARRFLARPGAFVAVRHAVDGPASVVNVLKRPRA